MFVIGIDPGPVVGIVRLFAAERKLVRADALQVTPGALLDVLGGLVYGPAALTYEQFVVGPRAARSSTPAGGAEARNVIGLITEWARNFASDAPLILYRRPAAMVKPWATDERLDAAGLLEPTKGMRHARDAARYALYCAVRDYGLPDPLSRGAR